MAALLIQDGDSVIFDENNENKYLKVIKTTGTVRVGKANVRMSEFIGAPFGAVFTLTPDGQHMQRVNECPTGEWAQGPATEVERNNAGLFDRNTGNQKLSHEDIAAMKEAGKGGQEIIEALCSNSATFQAKTEFSQEKYKRKKAKKYLMMLTLRRPTGRWICQMYYDKGPERVYNLRPDSLAIMMSLANVAAGAQVLVIDGCMGVVAASVVERLGGLGAAVIAHVDHPTNQDPVKALNLTPQQAGCMHPAALRTLLQIKAQQAAALAAPTTATPDSAVTPAAAGNGLPAPAGDNPAQPAAAAPADVANDNMKMDVDSVDPAPANQAPAADAASTQGLAGTPAGKGGAEGAPVGAGKPVPNGTAAQGTAAGSAAHAEAGSSGGAGKGGAAAAAEAPVQGSAAWRDAQRLQRAGKLEALEGVVRGGFTCCVVASPQLDPTTLIQQVLPLLAPSAAFVIFSCWPQPLAECLTHLQRTRQAVLLQLQESWMRPYQVLPARTHPHMMCAGTGGLILSGIKVVADATPGPAVAGAAAGAGVGAPAAGAGVGEEEEAAGDDRRQRGGRGGGAGRGGGRGGGRGKRGRHA